VVHQEKHPPNATKNVVVEDLGNVARPMVLNSRSEERAYSMTNPNHDIERKRNVHPLVLGMMRLRWRLRTMV
jgi:hypothetical protein